MTSSKYPNLGFDPAPGDLETVRALVSAVGRVSREGGTAHTQLSRIGTSDSIWAGKAAEAFTESIAEAPPYLKKALDSLGSALRALTSWETSLGDFQSRARSLEEEAAAAAKKVSSTKGALDGVSDDTDGLTAKEKDDLKDDKKGKKDAHDDAADELEAVRSRGRSLNAEYVTAADSVSRTVKEAADDAPPEPGWLDDLKDFASKAWDTITDPEFWKAVGDVLADVAMVIGVLAMIGVPGLGLIGLIVAGGALAAHLAAWAGGAKGVTWKTLAWDAAGLFAGARAFKGLKLAKSGKGLMKAGRNLKAMGQANAKAGRALRAASGFKASVGKAARNTFKQSPWKNAQGIRDGARNSMEGFRQTRGGLREIARGDRMVSAGENMVARGSMLDQRWTQAGVGLAGGSNLNGDRWLDGDWNSADIPVVGTAPALVDYDYGQHADPPQALSSAGGSFANGIAV